MSEYDSFDDSFESGSESENGLFEQQQEAIDGPGKIRHVPLEEEPENPLSSKSDTLLQMSGGFEIHRVKELALPSTKGAMSDPDETHPRSE